MQDTVAYTIPGLIQIVQWHHLLSNRKMKFEEKKVIPETDELESH